MKTVNEVRYSASAKNFIEMRPEEELKTINELLKILIKAWDNDFSKVTRKEKEHLEHIEQEIDNGVYYSEEDVWK